MKTQKNMTATMTAGRSLRTALAGAALAGVCWTTGGLCQAQDAPADFSPGLQQVVNLSKAGMSDDFIQTYITNSGRSYALSVDDIIYLHKQGVSDGVIKDLMQTPTTANPNTAPVAPPPTLPPPVSPVPDGNALPSAVPPPVDASAPAPVSVSDTVPSAPPTLPYFQSQLAPYGNWVAVAGLGQCWRPEVDPGWRPYYDGGHWVDTDSGWYWQSDYPWGDIVFHYGRWTYTSVGWVWAPGYDYAPCWVVWRQADADGCVGWAPIPPGAIFIEGGWQYRGNRVGMDFDFGLGANFFTFVSYDHFWEHNYRPFCIPSDRVDGIYRRSAFENHYRAEHGVFVNEGLNRGRVAAFGHQENREMHMQDLRRQEEQHNITVRNSDVDRYRNDGNRPGSFQNGNHFGNPGQEQRQPQQLRPDQRPDQRQPQPQSQPQQPRNNNNNGFHGGYNMPNHSPAGVGAPSSMRMESGTLIADSRGYEDLNANPGLLMPRQEMTYNNNAHESNAHESGNGSQHYQAGGFSSGTMHGSSSQRASGSSQGGGQNGNNGRSNQH